MTAGIKMPFKDQSHQALDRVEQSHTTRVIIIIHITRLMKVLVIINLYFIILNMPIYITNKTLFSPNTLIIDNEINCAVRFSESYIIEFSKR
jgi:hypothetical protein